MVRGKVNGKEVCILVDTGADYGLVPRAVVPENAVDCGERLISGVHGDSVLHKCTKSVFEVAGLTLEREVVIDDSRDGSLVNCILPLDLTGGGGEIDDGSSQGRRGKRLDEESG